jgi:lipopolysaccharide/colanic/teichoic acid biosynthesis glycosyltransferase
MKYRYNFRIAMKRIIDVLVSGTLLICFAPILGVVAVLILTKMGRPILFRQLRAGYMARPFTLYKFRTMMNADVNTDLPLSDEDARRRLTPFGNFLRASSLDELPQLWNVLIGDMSLVGPRPLLMAYVPRYTKTQARRHDVKPGITGLAQIQGRNAITWEDKFERDVWYVQKFSLWLDFKILCLTVLKVMRREGIQNANSATMPEFLGSQAERAHS